MSNAIFQVYAQKGTRRVVTELSSVSVFDLRISADIGVHEHEIGHPQELVISAIVELRPRKIDKINATLDYTHIVALAEQLGQQRIALIETFAHRLAEACLAHPLAERADIRVSKPGALPAGVAGARTILRKAG